MNTGTSENKPDFAFTSPSYKEWEEVARLELDGADPTEKLTIRKEDLEILPFYTDSQNKPGARSVLKPSSNPYLGARAWVNTPRIIVYDEHQANEIALSYLNSGAEGLLFECQSGELNPMLLLNKISLTDCSVSFLIHVAPHTWLNDFQLFAENNFNKDEIKGCLFWRSIPVNYTDIAQSFAPWPQFYSLGILTQPHEGIINEIALSLKNAVQLVDAASEKKISAQIVLDQISFSTSVNTDFFIEVAKLKSLRNLWNQVRGAYNSSTTRPLHIHANSKVWIKDGYQPHGNMIKSTTAAMSSIAGGCDSLTVEPENLTNETMSRIARNVSSILRDESHFSKVADPTAGSYYIDSLTDQLSEKAWNKFQSLMK